MSSWSKGKKRDCSKTVNRVGILDIHAFSHEFRFDANNDSIETVAYDSHFGLTQYLKHSTNLDLEDKDLNITGVRIYKGMS